MQNISLSERISEKLVGYSHRVLTPPAFVHCFGLSEAKIKDLQKLFPKAYINSGQINELNNLAVPIANETIDLIIANLAHARFKSSNVLANIKRLLHKNGLGIIGIFTDATISQVEKNARPDENAITENLAIDVDLQAVSQSEHLVHLASGSYVDCRIFAVSKAEEIDLLKKLIRFAPGAGSKEDGILEPVKKKLM